MSPTPLSSTPILRTTLIWSAGVMVALALIAGVFGFIVADSAGLVSGVVGVLVAATFFALTAASILFANRWFGDPLYVPIFFGVVLGGWMVKLGLFLVAILILREQPWIEPLVFFFSLIASVMAALIVDVVVLTKMRVPHASDVTLPTASEINDPADRVERDSDAG